jgi:O-acetylhomoserine (thiol)-lyase
VNYELASKYLPKGAGGVLTFVVKGGKEKANQTVENLKLASHLANVGDVRTLIIQPSATTHSQLSDNEQLSAGVHPAGLRVSVGIEHIDDIIADFEQALEKI